MKKIFSVIFLAACFFLNSCLTKSTPRVLVFSKTAGYRHSSIDTGKLALLKLGSSNKFIVDTTEDAAKFTEANLKKYAAVVFLNTTGNVLNANQEAAFERFIQVGFSKFCCILCSINNEFI